MNDFAALAPLWVLAGVFLVFGALVAGAPADAREFFARQARVLLGKNAGDRYAELPEMLFRVVGVVMLLGGIGFAMFALSV